MRWSQIICALLCVASISSVYGQLPDLGAASLDPDNPTSARFLGGASADNGSSFGTEFGFDEPIDILTEIQVEPGHVGTVGNTYLLIVLDDVIFMLQGDGNFGIWDFNLANLVPLQANKTLAASEPFTLVDDVAFGPLGVFDTTLLVVLAYDTEAAPGNLFLSATPITVTIGAEQTQAASLTLFQANISEQIILGSAIQLPCVFCHVTGGQAGGSDLILQPSNVAGFQQSNYDALVSYVQSRGVDTLIARPQGVSHPGGALLGNGTTELSNWIEFVQAISSELGQ